ncbi:NrfD/PsrC family molybdoenzyme membrane anchor subunit [Chloroflexota bacterium]
MSSTFVSIDGKSRGYKTLVTVLVVLALSGLISFVGSYIQGHQTFGSSNVIPWGMPIVLTIYLIGLSAGSLILSSLTYVFGREEYRPIARMAVYLAIVLIFGALLSIAIDLGRPEKFWRLLMFFYMNNMSSMFAINGILYGGYFVLTLTYLVLIFSGLTAYVKKMGVVAVCWAVLVHMGTGAIFGFIAAREAWVSPIKPLEFLAAAITSGVALLILAVVLTLKFTGRKVNREMVVSLGRMLSVFIIILMVLIFVDKMTHFYSPERGATVFMLAGQYSWMFWVLQVGLVAVVPLAILFNPRLNKTVRYVSLGGSFCRRRHLLREILPGNSRRGLSAALLSRTHRRGVGEGRGVCHNAGGDDSVPGYTGYSGLALCAWFEVPGVIAGEGTRGRARPGRSTRCRGITCGRRNTCRSGNIRNH